MELDSNIISFVKQAFSKLKASLYYEKNNLHLRQQMVDFCSEGIGQKLDNLSNRLLNGDSFDDELNKIGLFLLPKKIKSTQSDPNILSNSFDFNKNEIERLMIYADIPIELHIVAVLWVMLFGSKLDKELDQYCWGNRLIIDEDTEEIKAGRHLFKPYFKQYQQWWSKAIDEANHLLENKENVCILNLDIQNYYHSIRIKPDDLKNKDGDWNDSEKIVWQLFLKIHQKYNEVLCNFGFREDDFENGFALPVGLLSSPLLANCYLKGFDQKVNEVLTPAYYGRYVDDILIVVKHAKQPKSIKSFIDKLNIGLASKETKDGDANKTIWYLDEMPKLTLQQEKIFLYYFDHKFSSELLSKFEKEQREHSSEYRFLSDEEDERFDDGQFDIESCFDQMEDSKARFKPQSENKYKLACYLSKFIKRRIQRGAKYGREKEKQLKKFFQGSQLIKYHFFWEKLFSLYAVSNDADSFLTLKKQIEKQIDKLKVATLSDWRSVDCESIVKEMKEDLRDYLKIAMKIAISVAQKEFVGKIEEKIESVTDFDCYYKCHYVRKTYFSRVLQDFFNGDGYQLDSSELFVPYNVYLWELMYALTYNYLHIEGIPNTGLDLGRVYEEAQKYYHGYNGFSIDKDCKIQINPSNDEKHRNQKLWDIVVSKKEEEQEDQKESNKIRIVPVNIRKHDATLKDSRRGKRKVTSSEVETMLSLLDSIGLIKGRDMFVMPELSIPLTALPQFVEYSTRQEIAFVGGLEYINVKGVVYNVEVTCLPIEINHVKDCVLIPRIKNYYSPYETEIIKKESFEIPKCSDPENKPSYHLYRWRGLYFTTFNCFELTKSPDRTSFVGDVDLLIAITHNKDLSYFDNIAETTCRDLHCYVVVDNVGQYGDTQVVCPKKRDEKFLAKIKGATTEDNPFTLTIADLDIKGLREFQKYLSGDFKPLPAGYKNDCERLKEL